MQYVTIHKEKEEHLEGAVMRIKWIYKKWIVGTILLSIAMVIIFYWSEMVHYFSLEELKNHRLFLQQFVQAHSIKAVVIFMGVYTAATACALPITFILSLAGGFLFGGLAGGLYAVISATAGATISFLVVRSLARQSTVERYARQHMMFNNLIQRYGVYALLIIRLIPLFPFFLINIIAPFLKIPLKTFVWTTGVGILPASMVYAFAGKQLLMVDSVKDLFTWNIVLLFAAFAALVLSPLLFKNIYNHMGHDN